MVWPVEVPSKVTVVMPDVNVPEFEKLPLIFRATKGAMVTVSE